MNDQSPNNDVHPKIFKRKPQVGEWNEVHEVREDGNILHHAHDHVLEIEKVGIHLNTQETVNEIIHRGMMMNTGLNIIDTLALNTIVINTNHQ